MSGVGFNPLEEGDTLDAASLNTIFTAITAFINDLPSWAIAEKGVGYQHFSGSPLVVTGSSVAGTVDQGLPGSTGFSNEWPGTGSNTYSAAPAAGDVAWTLLKQGSTEAIREWTAVNLGMAAGNHVAAILVRFNVERDAMTQSAKSVITEEYASAMALQWKDGAGTWRTLKRTERHLTQTRTRLAYANPASKYVVHPDYRDMALATLISSSDLVGASPANTIAGVRIVVGINKDVAASPPGIVADSASTRFAQFNLTTLPVRGADPI